MLMFPREGGLETGLQGQVFRRWAASRLLTWWVWLTN